MCGRHRFTFSRSLDDLADDELGKAVNNNSASRFKMGLSIVKDAEDHGRNAGKVSVIWGAFFIDTKAALFYMRYFWTGKSRSFLLFCLHIPPWRTVHSREQ